MLLKLFDAMVPHVGSRLVLSGQRRGVVPYLVLMTSIELPAELVVIRFKKKETS